MNLNLYNDHNYTRFTTFEMVLKTPYNNTLFTFHIIHVKFIRRQGRFMNVLKITSDNRLKFSPCKIFDAFAAVFALFLRTTTSSNISS